MHKKEQKKPSSSQIARLRKFARRIAQLSKAYGIA